MNPAKHLKYSYTWALTIMEGLYKNYPRATETVLGMLDITAKQAALFLAYGDPVWAQLREAIHIADNWLLSAPLWYDSYTCVKAFRDVLNRKSYERLVKRLDECRLNGMLEEQGSREGAEEPQGDESPQPYSPSSLQLELFA